MGPVESSWVSKTFSVELPDDVADWLAAQPDRGADLIEGVVREKMAFSTEAPPLPPSIQEGLEELRARDPEAATRADALKRYPQLVEALARGLISIDRAEAMAVEADSRS